MSSLCYPYFSLVGTFETTLAFVRHETQRARLMKVAN
jgi:hypothetical protein